MRNTVDPLLYATIMEILKSIFMGIIFEQQQNCNMCLMIILTERISFYVEKMCDIYFSISFLSIITMLRDEMYNNIRSLYRIP